MMRGLDKVCMAVRRPNGEIFTDSWEAGNIANPGWYRKIWVLRGFVNLADSLRMGYKCLMKSADIAGESLPENDIESENKSEAANNTEPENRDAATESTKSEENNETTDSTVTENQKAAKTMGAVGVFSMIIGVALALFLFTFLPAFTINSVERFVSTGMFKTALEGLVRILIFIGYLSLISLMKDIQKLFAYHGAEHKTIACYEAGEELKTENVKKFKRFHPRCGTSFILIVLLLSVIVFSFIPRDNFLFRVASQIILLPVIAGISYEFIKLAGRHDNIVTRIVSAPGIFLQRLTTREPDEAQIEVAISAMSNVVPANKDQDKW